MIELFLVRHGDSPFTGIDDHQRPLSELGQKQAAQAGSFINNSTNSPYEIFCSDALRTQMTADLIKQIIQASTTTSHNHLYHARVGDWCDIIQQHNNSSALVLVGHNPTITYLAKYLIPIQQQVYSPACVGHYQLEITADGLKLPARLIEFYKPDAK